MTSTMAIMNTNTIPTPPSTTHIQSGISTNVKRRPIIDYLSVQFTRRPYSEPDGWSWVVALEPDRIQQTLRDGLVRIAVARRRREAASITWLRERHRTRDIPACCPLVRLGGSVDLGAEQPDSLEVVRVLHHVIGGRLDTERMLVRDPASHPVCFVRAHENTLRAEFHMVTCGWAARNFLQAFDETLFRVPDIRETETIQFGPLEADAAGIITSIPIDAGLQPVEPGHEHMPIIRIEGIL
jgi:hypothetical protein